MRGGGVEYSFATKFFFLTDNIVLFYASAGTWLVKT